MQNGTPTTSSPIAIKSAGDDGSITEKISNKNLLDIQGIIKGSLNNGEISYVENTTNLTLNENSFSFTTDANYRGVTSDFFSVNTNFIASFLYTTKISVVVGCYDKNKTFISNATRTWINDNTYKFEVANNTKFVRIYFYLSSAGSTTVSNPMIEFGNSATSYIEHQEQTFTIPCQQPMRSIGDIRDTFVKENGVWYERHNIIYIASYNGETITTDYLSTTGGLDTGASVQYIAETPTDIACTQEQVTALEAIEKARTYKNATNILSEDTTPAYITTTYIRDLESAILSYIDASVNQAIGGDY